MEKNINERISMDVLRELYIAYSESQEAEDAMKETDNQLFEYMKFNIPAEEKTAFFEIINSIMEIRAEYFFKKGFKTAVKIMFER